MRFLDRVKAFFRGLRRSLQPRRPAHPPARSRRVPGRGGGASGGPATFVRLADRYMRLGMVDTALHICVKGLEESPDHLEGLMAISRIYLAKGMLEEAKGTVERLIQERPDSQEVAELYERLEGLGASPVIVGKPVFREKVEERARQVRTGEIASDTQAERYLRKGDVDKAIEVYEDIFRRKPHNVHLERRLEELRALKESQVAGTRFDVEGASEREAATDEQEAEEEAGEIARPPSTSERAGGDGRGYEEPPVASVPAAGGAGRRAASRLGGEKLPQIRALESWLGRIRTFRERYSE